uniref:Uncharacterized protein n=1 Tax=Colletotrichum scovillei TaxID=1209932 RepID=A0A9P7UFG6_9PEZI
MGFDEGDEALRLRIPRAKTKGEGQHLTRKTLKDLVFRSDRERN